MASKTEQRKIQIIADGSSVNASMQEMQKASRLLWQEMSKLPANSEDFVKKSKEFQTVKKRLDDTKKAANETEKSLNDLANEALAMSPFGGIINGINGAFLKTKSALTIVSASFKTLQGAIVSTGLGALVVALGLVINYLMTTQDGMDRVNKVLQPLSSLFQRFIGVLQDLGGFLIDSMPRAFASLRDAIANPFDTLKSFSEFIVNNFLNRVKSIGVAFQGVQKILSRDFAGGLKDLGDAMIQATTGIENGVDQIGKRAEKVGDFFKNAIDEGSRLADLQINIEKAEIELTKNRQRYAEEYKKAAEIAENVAASSEERAAAAQKAIEVTNQRLKEEQDLLDMKIEKLTIEQNQNDTSREGEMEMAELIAQRAELETAASEARTTARSKLNVANQAMAAEDKKRHEEALKRMDEAQKKEDEENKRKIELRKQYEQAEKELIQSTEDLRVASMENGADKEIAQRQLQLNRELEALEAKNQAVLQNEVVTQEEKLAIEEQYLQLAEMKRREFKEATEEIRLEEKLTKFEEDQALEIQLLENAMIGVIDAEQRKADALLEIQRHYAAEKLALLEAAGEGESLQALKLKNTILKIDQEIADGKIANEQKVKDAKQFLAQTQFEAAKGFMQLGFELLNEDMKARKAFINGFKAIQIGQIISDGVREIAAIWKNSMSNPMNALIPGFGQALAVAQTALAASRTGLAVNRIRSQQFAVGGSTGSGQVIDLVMDSSGTWRMPNGQGLRDVGTFKRGGRITSPSFGAIAEAGEEWVGPNWMIRSPKYANIFGYLEAERRKATPYATGGMTAAPMQIPQNSSATADLQQTMMMIEQFGELNMKFDMMISIMQAWPTRLRVVNDPRDILDGVRVLNEIESDSRINR